MHPYEENAADDKCLNITYYSVDKPCMAWLKILCSLYCMNRSTTHDTDAMQRVRQLKQGKNEQGENSMAMKFTMQMRNVHLISTSPRLPCDLPSMNSSHCSSCKFM